MSMMRAAGKKDADKPRKKKTQQHHQTSTTAPPVDKEQDQPPATNASTPEVTVWHFVINQTPITIAFRKKHRSVWINSIEVETEEESLRLSGMAIKFEIYEKEAVITYMTGDKPSNDVCELRYVNNVIQPKPMSK